MLKTKNYIRWMSEKASIHNRHLYKFVNEGDVVWAAVGENVGVEIDGKSKKYSRPVIVIKKHDAKSFTGIPLTSKTYHRGNWYVHFRFQKKEEVAILTQAKLFDATRVYSRIGELSKGDFKMIKKAFLDYYSR